MAALASAPPGAYGQELPLQLTWVDRKGKAIESIGPPGSYRGPDVSADGRVAVHQHDRLGGDIWLLDTKGQMTRFTTDATGTQENSSPIFSPDGTRIVFASLRNGKWGLYREGHERRAVKSCSTNPAAARCRWPGPPTASSSSIGWRAAPASG